MKALILLACLPLIAANDVGVGDSIVEVGGYTICLRDAQLRAASTLSTVCAWTLPNSSGRLGLGYSVEQFAPDHAPLVEQALATWAVYLPTHFQPAPTDARKTLAFYWAPLNSGILGLGHWPCATNEPMAGDVLINSMKTWTDAKLLQVLRHEVGHALGLGHSTDPTSIMYPYLGEASVTITAAEIQALGVLYPPAQPSRIGAGAAGSGGR